MVISCRAGLNTGMAAVNYIKNRRNQKMREGLDHFVARCLDSEENVKIERVVEIFDATNHVIDEKEMEKLSSIANDEKIPKQKFVEFCKSSPLVRSVLESEVKGGQRSRSASQQGFNSPSSLRKLKQKDRAAMAFKAVDTDRSGYLDKNEFSNFTRSVSPGNRDRLFTNMDKDGDGKIDFKEFQVLFKK